MGGCVGKPSAEVGHGTSPHGAADATVNIYSGKAVHQPQQFRDKQLLPALPDTPLKGYTIPAGPGHFSREDITLPATAPSPLSKVRSLPRRAAPGHRGRLMSCIIHHGRAHVPMHAHFWVSPHRSVLCAGGRLPGFPSSAWSDTAGSTCHVCQSSRVTMMPYRGTLIGQKTGCDHCKVSFERTVPGFL